jgi:sortase A
LRRLTRAAAALLLVVGVLAVTESALTFAWQEPVTAFFAHRQQEALEDQLTATRTALLSPTPSGQRVAALAARLEDRAEAGDALGRIHIPKLGVNFVFVAGAGSKSLKRGPGHYDSTVLPGQQGTVGLAGHRTTYLAPFRKLDRLRRGDEIAITMPYGRFSYAVTKSLVVAPSGIAVLRQTREDRLVLTTCTPLFSAAKRLVIVAAQRSEMPLGAAVGDPFPYRPKS